MDTHAQIRRQLADWIGRQSSLAFCGETDNERAAVAAIESANPQLVLMDLTFNDTSGLATLAEIHRRWPQLPVLAISIHDSPHCQQKALQAGALGYITKQAAVNKLLTAIQTVMDGQVYLEQGNLTEAKAAGDKWKPTHITTGGTSE